MDGQNETKDWNCCDEADTSGTDPLEVLLDAGLVGPSRLTRILHPARKLHGSVAESRAFLDHS